MVKRRSSRQYSGVCRIDCRINDGGGQLLRNRVVCAGEISRVTAGESINDNRDRDSQWQAQHVEGDELAYGAQAAVIETV